MKMLALWAMCAACVQAQTAPVLRGLATNADGSVLYFSTTATLRGAPQVPVPWSKILRWQRGQVSVAAQVATTDFSEVLPLLWQGTGFYQLFRPQVGPDGRLVAYTAVQDCNWGTPCAYSLENYRSTVRITDAAEREFAGSIELSPNGQFGYLMPSRVQVQPLGSWVDLVAGRVEAFPHRVAWVESGSHFVSDNGYVAQCGDGVCSLARPEGVLSLRGFTGGGAVRVSARADWAFSASMAGVVAFDVAGQRQNAVTSGADDAVLDISADGSVVLVKGSDAVRVVRRTGEELLRLAVAADEGVLSGDGRIAFVAHSGGTRVVRMDPGTGSTEEVLASPRRTVLLGWTEDAGAVAPGSLIRIRGSQDVSLARVRLVRFRGALWPMLRVDPEFVMVQVPWDTQPGGSYLELLEEEPADAPEVFERAVLVGTPVSVRANAGRFFVDAARRLVGAHEDFSSLLTAEDPARAGEVLHLYGTGFGAVASPPPAGVATGADGLHPVAAPLACKINATTGESAAVEAPVVWAGLAPGFLGVYQVDLRVPAGTPPGQYGLRCLQGVAFTPLVPLTVQ